ncbi:hypothetical protein QBC39DRAFT_362209 [Podospora conica]|nr:hypothetical protein QBC39DRAFT_362209 [Schizothecium conicum]
MYTASCPPLTKHPQPAEGVLSVQDGQDISIVQFASVLIFQDTKRLKHGLESTVLVLAFGGQQGLLHDRVAVLVLEQPRGLQDVVDGSQSVVPDEARVGRQSKLGVERPGAFVVAVSKQQVVGDANVRHLAWAGLEIQAQVRTLGRCQEGEGPGQGNLPLFSSEKSEMEFFPLGGGAGEKKLSKAMRMPMHIAMRGGPICAWVLLEDAS